MAATRIYIITPKTSIGIVPPRLVRSTHPATALRHVADDTLNVTVASQDDLVRHVAAGVAVEDVKPEQLPLPT